MSEKVYQSTTKVQSLPTKRPEGAALNSYILGPGDTISVEILDLPELSGIYSVGPDGTIYLPRLRAVHVEGLNIEELRISLTKKFKTFVLNPEIYLRILAYRPIRIYVGGEVKRPGYYTLTGEISRKTCQDKESNQFATGVQSQAQFSAGASANLGGFGLNSSKALFPTVFDAIRSAQGITPYSDLRDVQVVRKRAEIQGGGRIMTSLNFLALLTEGDDTQNIRLFDGDVLTIKKSS